MSRPLPLRAAATALVGPTIWAAHFLAVYASESLLCRAGAPGWHDGVVTAATLVALLSIAWHGGSQWSRRKMGGARHELARIAIALDALSALAVCFAGLAAATLPACA